MAINLLACNSNTPSSTATNSQIFTNNCTPEVLEGSGNITLQGTLSYTDKHYDNNGFTGKTRVLPARFIHIELLDDNDKVVSRHTSDQLGNYQLHASQNGSYRLRILTKTQANCHDLDMQIRDLEDFPMAVTQTVNLTSNNNPLDITISHTHPLSGAFNILDVYTTAAEFILQNNSPLPPPLNIYWSPGAKQLGTYYCLETDHFCPNGQGIYILSGSSGDDTDEFDDDVLWHEYGHFVAEQYAQDNSEGGQHSLRQNDLDLRLAFSEGWGNFFPLAIKNWLLTTKPTLLSMSTSNAANIYVDTTGENGGWSYDFSTTPTAPYIYASNEVAVTTLLRQLHLSYGVDKIWRVMTDHLKHLNTPTNLEAFWDGWLNLHTPNTQELNNLYQHLALRQIFYQPDDFEEDDDLSNSNPLLMPCLTSDKHCQTERHTLYETDDEDVLQLQLVANTQYSIKTLNLHNGTDTVIELIDAHTLQVVAENDNFLSLSGLIDNDTTSLSSLISYTPEQNGRYYVRVTSSSKKLKSAGRYGDYAIQLLTK